MLWDEAHLGDDQVVLGGRPFAEHDQVLALRNDYQLGLLNGTRAVVERIDTSQHEMTLATTDQTRLVVPFAYAEAGHLTHGYATTIHKAQGATVDRCFVLGDDTLTREHAYTALSRGRHANHLYVVTDDRRVDDRHAPEIDSDPLDTVRHAIGRRAAKTMAVDQFDPQSRRSSNSAGNATPSAPTSATGRRTRRRSTATSPKRAPGRPTTAAAPNGGSTTPANPSTVSAPSAAEPTGRSGANSSDASMASRRTSLATT